MVAWQGGDVQLGLYEYRTTYNGGDVQRSKKSQKKKGISKRSEWTRLKKGERIAEPVKDKKGKVQEISTTLPRLTWRNYMG